MFYIKPGQVGTKMTALLSACTAPRHPGTVFCGCPAVMQD